MRKVELVAGVKSSVLGFGCAPVLGAVGGKVAERAICCALDHGVTHFDLARSYGYGEAEKFVGRLLRERRDQVVIASKFGIRATWKATLLRPLKPLVRTLKGSRSRGVPATVEKPPATEVVRRDPFHERIPLGAKAMRSSLEASLKALGTDYLDLLFVHEPAGAMERLDEMCEAAGVLKAEGKIRGWGLAFDWSKRDELTDGFGRFDILQFNNSPGVNHYENARRDHGDKGNIFFSPFRGSGGMKHAEVLGALWQDFPRSVVLASMFDPAHIAANASVADEAAAGN